MKGLIKILSIFLFISCAPAIEVFEYTKDIAGENLYSITFDSAKEAERVKKRIEKRGLYVPINESTLILSIGAIELKRYVFKRRGYIAKKYKKQIREQL